MARKTNNENTVEIAERTLAELREKREALTAARKNDETEMASVSYSAHTGDERAAAKLETLRDRSIRHDVEARNLDSAIAEAQRRVAAAQNVEREAEEAKIAGELLELGQLMRESGAKAERGLKILVEGSNELCRIIIALQSRGLGNPSAAQLQALERRAILGALVESPYARDFEHVAPRERQSLALISDAWATAIERAANIKLNREGGEENAA